MAVTIRSTTGTYLGDPNNMFVDEETTIDPSTNTLSIVGTFSNNGTIYPISGSFSMPAPSATSPTYMSLQISSTGILQWLTSTTAMPTLQSGNVLILFSDVVPQNAPSNQAFSSDTEPVLD